MTKSNLNKIILKNAYSRRFPDPLNELENGDPYNIDHHILLCKAIDIPSGISKAPNPREQKTDYGIYKEVKKSLETETDYSFHLKNKGITILAHRIEYSADKRVATIYYLSEQDGIADGGHTYDIILQSQSEGACPDGQYVKVEILTGIPDSLRVDIAGGLNTAVQVQDASLANLEGKFDWIKKIIKDEPYGNQIAYKQNEKKQIDIRDIISFLTLFNVEHPDIKGRHPKEAYASKAACLKLYKANQASYEMLAPLLKDILYLSDYIHIASRKQYNDETAGRSGGMTGVFESRKSKKPYKFVFINKENEFRLYDGTLYPILGALRFLVEQKPGDKYYSWKLKDIEEVKSFFNSIAADMITRTYNTSLKNDRNPNATGKDSNHWETLYLTVKVKYLEKKYE